MTNLKRMILALAAATGLLLVHGEAHAAAQAAAAQVKSRADVVRLRRVAVTDSAIFSRPVETASLLIPADWSFEGNIPFDLRSFQWCPENAFSPRMQAQSSSGEVGVATFPAFQTMTFRNPILAEDARRRVQMGQGFCPQREPMSMTQFVEQVLVPVFRPGSRVLGVEPVASLQRKVQQQLAATPMPPNARANADAAEVVIGYVYKGKQVEEHIYVVGGWRGESVTPGSSNADVIFSLYTPLIGLRVPAGQFQQYKQQFANIIASIKPNWHFYAAVGLAIQQQRSNIFNNFIAEIQRSSQIWRASWEAANSATKQREAAASQSQSVDVAGSWSDTILDVQNYKDANGETVQLSGGYNHVYSNRNGEYIQTNDPSYDPNIAAGGQWQAIEAMRR
jgi:hypothetical protein